MNAPGTNKKIDLTKRQYKMDCVQQFKRMPLADVFTNEKIYNYLKTFERRPSRTMYGQFKQVIQWIKRMFDRYCVDYRFTIEYDERNCIHIHGVFITENRMKRRWFKEKTEQGGFVFINPVDNYDNVWNYIIKDLDEIQEIVEKKINEKLCLHNFIFHRDSDLLKLIN